MSKQNKDEFIWRVKYKLELDSYRRKLERKRFTKGEEISDQYLQAIRIWILAHFGKIDDIDEEIKESVAKHLLSYLKSKESDISKVKIERKSIPHEDLFFVRYVRFYKYIKRKEAKEKSLLLPRWLDSVSAYRDIIKRKFNIDPGEIGPLNEKRKTIMKKIKQIESDHLSQLSEDISSDNLVVTHENDKLVDWFIDKYYTDD